MARKPPTPAAAPPRSARRREGLAPRIASVILDGYSVVFVEYDVEAKAFRVDPETGVYPLDADSLRRIVRVVVATYKKLLNARVLASDFGYRSGVARKAVRAFYNALANPGSKRAENLFEEWRKLASHAYPLSGEQLRKIAEYYGFSREEAERVDGVKLFYAIQTYYALVLKLLAAEVAARFYDSVARAYIKRLKVTGVNPREELSRLESGFVYKWYKVRNFLEGDLFGWYLDEWNSEISEAVKGVIATLDEYDVEALTCDPSTARDVFKLLYEELVPREEVRKFLGIYTTPDWLAELILDELGLSVKGLEGLELRGVDPLSIRVLDPGVGTGTFLSLIIQRIASYLRRKYPGGLPHEIAKRALLAVTKNVVGFDIDALALLTAKTNYLLALAAAGLLEHKGDEEVEIPIYMANSVVTAEELKDRITERVGEKYVYVEVIKVPTAVGDFVLPARLVESGRPHEFLSTVQDLLEREWPSESSEAESALGAFARVCASQEEAEACLNILKDFYGKLLELKKGGRDSVWIPIIKGHILPTLFKKSFDFVVGNPPWLAYRYIADPAYQEKVKSLIAKTYELVTDEHLMTHMEMATLFFVRAIDAYLKDGDRIGFVMPKSIFSSDQHDKFRSCEVRGVTYGFAKVIDCENVEPLFYVPACAVIARKGFASPYPVDAVVVSGKLPAERHKVLPLDEARRHLRFEARKLYLNRIGARSWLDYKEVRIRTERSYYYEHFRQGATVVPQSCWLVDLIKEHGDFVFVATSKRVKVKGKVKREISPLPVEKKFIYGVLTSAEVMPFCHLPPNLAILPIVPAGNKYQVITREEAQRLGYAHLAGWLKEAEDIWKSVRGEKIGKMSLYQRLDYQHGIAVQDPKAKFKVVYLTSGTYLAAAVVNVEKVLSENPLLNGIIVESTLYHYGTNDVDEAFYLASVLNSSVLDELIKPMQSKGEFGERHIHKKPLEYPIPKYRPGDPSHKRLSELGRKASEIARRALPQILREYGYDERLKERGVLLPQEVATVRRRLREELGGLLEEMDALVVELLEGVGQGFTMEQFLYG
jgi:SAM-dependent methyltransferase